MLQSHAFANAMYEKVVDIFARRAGKERNSPATTFDAELITHAEALALPNQLDAKDTLSVLTSLMGHLRAGQMKKFYKPAIIDSLPILPLDQNPGEVGDSYQTLWKSFEPEWKSVASQPDVRVQEASRFALLQRYTWAMPAPLTASDSNQETDISLFDYARVSAALAACLAQQDPTKPEPALLVAGDVSGVQDWLYTFGSAGAAKSLRGRSFYLQLLSEMIAHYLLRHLDLPTANLLYAGGGNFYLLVPTSKVAEVQQLRREIGSKLLKMHGGALYVAIESTAVSEETFKTNISHAWSDVSRKLAKIKVKRFAELDDLQMLAAIGSPLPGTGESDSSCRICGRVMTPHEPKKEVLDANGGFRCGLCGSFEELGTQLRNAEFLVVSDVAVDEPKEVTDWQQGLRQLGIDVQLVCNANDLRDAKVKKDGNITGSWRPVDSSLIRIFYWQAGIEPRNFPDPLIDQPVVWAFRPLAQCVPITDKDDVATFDELKSDGIKRWGVLRMDVDDLGKLFRQGIPANNLCRVVGLSGWLRLFFEGHLPRVARAYNETEPRIYLMYAGGDDLFVVGGWSDLPILAHEIRMEFGKFVCENRNITISGGISIALGEKYPLYQAARDAGKAEHLAKDLPDKDGLAFLGQAVKWGQEYQNVSERVTQLTQWIEPAAAQSGQPSESTTDQARSRPLPRSFLMSLRAIDAEWRIWKKSERQAEWLAKNKPEAKIRPRYIHNPDNPKDLYLGPWLWHLTYTLMRAAERTKNNTLKQSVKSYVQSLVENQEIKTVGLAARWTELLTRRSKED